MFLRFFYELKQSGIPVSVKEYLTFLEAVDSGIADKKIDNFYYLSRASLVKDERHLDKFDRVFGHVFRGLESLAEGVEAEIPGSGCARSPNACSPRRRRRKFRRWAAGTRSWRS